MRDEKALRELWATLPSINCKGLCADSCTAIRMSPLEHDLVREAGVDIPDQTVTREGNCVALSIFNRCRVYAARPTICRIYGLFRALECGYGCVPEGGFIDNLRGAQVLNLAMFYGGAFPSSWSLERVMAEQSAPDNVRQMLKILRERGMFSEVVQTLP